MSSFPVAAEFPSADAGRVHVGRPLTQLRNGAVLILVSLLGVLPLQQIFRWYHGGLPPNPKTFLIVSFLLLFPFGLAQLLNAVRGLPRLTIGPQRMSLQHAFGTTWADWDSVDFFVVQTIVTGRLRRRIKTARATIIGPNASRAAARQIIIPDHFDVPIEQICADINSTRASCLGFSHAPDSVIAVTEPAPVGLQGFTVPWLTFALLAVLIGVFVLENRFPVTPAFKNAPSLRTLDAMGALDHAAILARGEWYRLFTAPLLHANVAHLAGNGVALLLGGWMLERLVGRFWFLVFFAVSALGGSLASLALQPPNLISVGASGALMGMFAGLFISSFRIGAGSAARTRLQVNSLRILIPSLLPSFSGSTGVHVDYGAHFGGALAGAALAFILLRSWSDGALIPQARPAAAIMAGISLVLFVGSAGIAFDRYPPYAVAANAPPSLPAIAGPAADGRAAYLRGATAPGDPYDHTLGQCRRLFPSGTGAVPGINCAN